MQNTVSYGISLEHCFQSYFLKLPYFLGKDIKWIVFKVVSLCSNWRILHCTITFTIRERVYSVTCQIQLWILQFFSKLLTIEYTVVSGSPDL